MKKPEGDRFNTIDLMQDRPWAIHPAKLEEIAMFIETRMDGRDVPLEAGAANRKRPEDAYQVIDGVAVIPIEGTIAKKMNMLTYFSGGTSTQLLKRDIQTALDDPKVKGIVLNIDSPGGVVDGTKELSDFVFASRDKKPIVAYADGMMASAAYWIGSAANAIVGNDTAMVGSIGVALTHYDRSGQDQQKGVTRTVISAGEYKRIASDEKPLSQEGQAYLQDMVNTIYSLFVESVAQNRGVDVQAVLSSMANGRDFIGKQAHIAGLIDHIGTLDQAINLAREAERKGIMNIKILQEEHPELYEQVFNLGAASVDPEAGTKSERARVTEILEAEGDPKITRQVIADGTASAEVFKLFFQAEKQAKSQKLEGLQSGLPGSVGHGAKEKGKDGPKDFNQLVDICMTETKCTRGDAIRHVVKTNPQAHEAWLAKQPTS